MKDKLRWAIIGTGKISNRFAVALNNVPELAELLAVGSRNQITANKFGENYHIPKKYGSYYQAISNPNVDIVYIATPGVFHHRDVVMCLQNGKHVLCEKAFTINANQAKELINLARKKKLFLMEAMWTRFFPIHIQIRKLLAKNAIGKVNGMTINFISKPPVNLKNRFYDINLGAGVLLDTASYGVSWASSLFGKPEAVTGLAHFGNSGADYQTSLVLRYPQGKIVNLMSSQISYEHRDAVIFGSHGKIVVHDPWYKPTLMTVYTEGNLPKNISSPLNNYNGYEYEIAEVTNCIQAGKTESDIMPLDESLSIMETLDMVREQWGFKYPFEQ